MSLDGGVKKQRDNSPIRELSDEEFLAMTSRTGTDSGATRIAETGADRWTAHRYSINSRRCQR